MKTRIVYTKFWNDSFIDGLEPAQKLLFIYLLTNERVNIIHCYEIPIRKILFETGLSRDYVAEAEKLFEEKGKFHFLGDYVLIVNSTRYENYNSPKHEVAKNNELNKLPENVRSFLQKVRGYPIDRVTIGLETINKKSENLTNNPESIICNPESINDNKEPDNSSIGEVEGLNLLNDTELVLEDYRNAKVELETEESSYRCDPGVEMAIRKIQLERPWERSTNSEPAGA